MGSKSGSTNKPPRSGRSPDILRKSGPMKDRKREQKKRGFDEDARGWENETPEDDSYHDHE